MTKEDIKEHEFKPGESGNPNGRPKKFINAVITELNQAGYKEITKSQIIEVYTTLLALPEESLKGLVSDTDQPMILRIIGKAMLGQKGFDVIERMLDRSYGKPQQAVDHTSGGEKLPTVIIEGVYGKDPSFRVTNETAETDELADAGNGEPSQV